MAFFIPQKGDVRVFGNSTKQVHPEVIRSFVGWVPQENTLFDVSVAENISPDGKFSPKVEQIIKEIGDLLPPLDLQIVDGGKNISEGQKQIICLLRAINLERPIYIFDEFTSALDIWTEEIILKLISKYLSDKTLIVITHKPIFEFSKVIWVDNGTVRVN